MKTMTRLVLEFSGIVLVGLGAAIFAVAVLSPPQATPATPPMQDPYLSRRDRSGDPLLHLPERAMLWSPMPQALPRPVRPVQPRYVRRAAPPPRPPVEQPIVRVTTVEPVPELPLYPER